MIFPKVQNEKHLFFEISSETQVKAYKGDGFVIADVLQGKSIAIFPEELDNLIDALQQIKKFNE